MDETTYKDGLLKKRGEILGAGGIKPLEASMENNTRQGDMADRASGTSEVHIQLTLKQTDRKTRPGTAAALSRRGRSWTKMAATRRHSSIAGAPASTA